MDIHGKINMRSFRQVLEFPDKLEAANYFPELKADKELQIIAVSYDGEAWLIRRFQDAFLAALPNENYFIEQSRKAIKEASENEKRKAREGNLSERRQKEVLGY